MQFTLISAVLVACMTAFVSGSPVPVPVANVEAMGVLNRELVANAVIAARSPQATTNVCTKFTCP
ncbi:hypothetical protein B0H34DRAFT_798493 [Crassisporium funariophilum]|nr:hypothetical protein B0H34DRAFT_798493 [Crassisporium funariophilum]